MVDDDSFLLRGVIVKAGRPSFEGFERKGERELPWRETTAVEDHRLLLSKHVSCLKIFHLKVSVLGSAYVLRTVIILRIALAFTIRYIHILSKRICTSDMTKRWGGMAAIGS